MSYNDDELEMAFGDDQLQADDDDVFDALNGDYDDIMDESDDELEDMMDAEDDQYSLGGLPEDETLAAREIVEQCTGALEDGTPKAAVAVALDMINPMTLQKQALATQAMYKPVLEFRSRLDFIEVLFTFPTAKDTNLRVFYNHLEKYGQKQDEVADDAESVPFCAITIVPIESMGTAYMVAAQPVFWALTSPTYGGSLNQIKVAFHAEDVNFFVTDENDIGGILAAVQREQQAEADFYEQAAEKEAERYAAKNAAYTFDAEDFSDDEDE